MKRLENSNVELHSVINAKPKQTGDATPSDKQWKEINVHYKDAHMNKVSGVAASYRTSRSLTEFKF